jgi:hypothetical protein
VKSAFDYWLFSTALHRLLLRKCISKLPNSAPVIRRISSSYVKNIQSIRKYRHRYVDAYERCPAWEFGSNADLWMEEDVLDCEVHGDRVMRTYKMDFSPPRGVEASSIEALSAEKFRMALAGPFRVKKTRPAAADPSAS